MSKMNSSMDFLVVYLHTVLKSYLSDTHRLYMHLKAFSQDEFLGANILGNRQVDGSYSKQSIPFFSIISPGRSLFLNTFLTRRLLGPCVNSSKGVHWYDIKMAFKLKIFLILPCFERKKSTKTTVVVT